MKRLFIATASALLLANPAVAEISEDIKKTCMQAQDFLGCVKALSGGSELDQQDELQALRNAMKKVASRIDSGISFKNSTSIFQPLIDELAIAAEVQPDSLAVKSSTRARELFKIAQSYWESKIFYDYARPVGVVRELGAQGLIGEFNPELGGFAIDSWKDPTEGTATILATNFLTYQAPGEEPSPPFAEYISGHSSFSAAGAEILKRFTGSDDFGGGITFEVGESVFEPGITPKVPVTLEWNTFSEASDQAGISRIYGGIHFEDGDLNGRALGREVAEHVWEKTQGVITPNTIIATNEKDNLIGSVTNDLIYSNRSDDIVFGNEGNDMLCGGKGNDIVNGGAGADLIYGDFGDDILIGGVGGDNFHFRSNDGNNIITDFEDGIDVIGLGDGLSFQQLTISQIGNDTRISANQLSITLQGVEESAINIEDFRDCKI